MKTEHRHKNLQHASNRELSKISSHKIFKIEILNLKHIFLILSIVVNFCGTFQHKQAFYLFLLWARKKIRKMHYSRNRSFFSNTHESAHLRYFYFENKHSSVLKIKSITSGIIESKNYHHEHRKWSRYYISTTGQHKLKCLEVSQRKTRKRTSTATARDSHAK